MDHLFNKLKKHHESNIYPFHMPGHKRNMKNFGNFFQMDITEIDGFDNLHHTEGILEEAQNRTAKLYGSKEVHFLVNGSTAGLLSAISGCTQKGDKILMARNCHKSVYNAVYLNDLEVEYLYPETISGINIAGGISSKKVETLINKDDRISVVVITSPTYEGVVSDIESIAQVVHKYKKLLIVDEAHGAHFGFHPYFPKSAIMLGADIVIQSLHKTMPALTQSALLHFNIDKDRKEYKKVKEYLSIYQTSSPSYLLVGSMDYVTELMIENRQELFEQFVEHLVNCRLRISRLKNIRLFGNENIGKHDIFELDYSKLVLDVSDTTINGNQLYQRLRNEYGLQLEMAAGNFGLAMTSCMDTIEGFRRLVYALKEVDHRVVRTEKLNRTLYNVSVKSVMSISDALRTEGKKVDFDKAAGCIIKEYIFLYPPGIPFIVPGEILDEQLIKKVREYQKQELNVQGTFDKDLKVIEVVR
ncbi:aminotransferase class I/II-fold pyridoxal phosphate-dependent enzyme [Anaerosacchariphilus polymeriproducens]|uniref:Aminotransferase class I/II-fold pyridoxal phosphate-dependent enzyme n=1 Tax=Anaerosacchariphilus polymeriproducens TaxID=1812858 RepID=A0A371AVL1_9FIRM|nr:aminotransferase class I/II-fold pyridoxal phosphate-dependent enzyme [Anaerosacchariphilus polymeriproducens]RDU23572.1 aminotransferase class I/II-fold pyridoxal phosphate-dependent enzyme [Anaerosacchariphilus polymeriproducens]